MNTCVKVAQRLAHNISEFIHSHMNIAWVPPTLWHKYAITKWILFATKFMPFARNLDWTKDVTLNHGKNLATGGGPLPGPEWIQTATEMTFLGLNQLPIFTVIYGWEGNMAGYCTSMRPYFHEPQASENTTQECNIQPYCLLTHPDNRSIIY